MKQFHKTRNLFKYSLTFSALATCISVATAAPITLVNQGFETGDLTGWSTVGTVVAAGQTNVTTNNGTNYLISPNDTTMAFLDSLGASISDIESFFGLSSGTFVTAVGPVFSESGVEGGGDGGEGGDGEPMAMAAIDVEEEIDDIPEMVDINLTNGSAISQSFMGLAGDTVSMSWNYAARDYIPFTDPAFSILIAPDGTAMVDVLASTTGPGLVTGSDGISGVFTFAEQLTQTGEYTLGFAVTNSGDQILNATLFIDDGAGECNPSCNELGSPENPLLPEEDDTPGSFDFSFIVTEPATPIFIDPIIAIGYDYIVSSGPNIASVILPNIGDGEYDIFGWDGADFTTFLGDAFAGIAFDFGSLGVDQFRVLGIETAAMLDPLDNTAFVTGLTFVSAGAIAMSQIPVTFDTDSVVNNVSAPNIVSLVGIGFLSLMYIRRRRNLVIQ